MGIASSQLTLKGREPFGVWWTALRFHFVPPSFLPAILGASIALQANGRFSAWYFFLVVFAIICNHLALNMTDDYYDYLQGADGLKPGEKNPYTGGSGILSSGDISPQTMYKAFMAMYFVTILVGIYLTVDKGWPVFALGLFGVFCSYYYTAPPVRFSYRGLGELGMLVNFGPVLVAGAYYVQTQRMTLELLLISLPLGILMLSQILSNELPDYLTDRSSGKMTLVARCGKRVGLLVATAAAIAAYLATLAAVIVGLAPWIVLISLLSAPLAYQSVQNLRRTMEAKNVVGNLEMMKAHDYAGILLIVAYCLQAVIDGRDIGSVLAILLTLLVLYYPVAVKFSKRYAH